MVKKYLDYTPLEALKKLRELAPGFGLEAFDMEMWAEGSFSISEIELENFDLAVVVPKFDCGTTCCLAGFAASSNWFNERGFFLVTDEFDSSELEKGTDVSSSSFVINDRNNLSDEEATNDFFGLSLVENSALFHRIKPTPEGDLFKEQMLILDVIIARKETGRDFDSTADISEQLPFDLND